MKPAVFVRLGFVAVFFFGLPLGAYRVAYFYTDRYFRWKGIPYPSESFAGLTGAGVCLWILGLAWILYGFLFTKKEGLK